MNQKRASLKRSHSSFKNGLIAVAVGNFLLFESNRQVNAGL